MHVLTIRAHITAQKMAKLSQSLRGSSGGSRAAEMMDLVVMHLFELCFIEFEVLMPRT